MPAAQVRQAAERVADWAIDHQNADVLATAIDVLLQSGASLDPDDPWSVHALVQALKALGGTPPDDHPTAGARGVLQGVSRLDLSLAPGESRTVSLIMAGDEAAIIEVRLKRGADAADIDLRVLANGDLLREDTGPATGTPEVGAYVEFWAGGCIEIDVEITNAGTEPANAVMLAPATSLLGCGG